MLPQVNPSHSTPCVITYYIFIDISIDVGVNPSGLHTTAPSRKDQPTLTLRRDVPAGEMARTTATLFRLDSLAVTRGEAFVRKGGKGRSETCTFGPHLRSGGGGGEPSRVVVVYRF